MAVDGKREVGEVGRRDGEEAENVIRIPRDWYGPKEELIPFGPAADRRAREEAEATAPLGADAFWGEDAASLHEVIQAPPERDAASKHPRELDATPPTVAAAPSRWAMIASGTRLGGYRAVVASAAAVLVLVLCGVALLTVGGPPSHPVGEIATKLRNEPIVPVRTLAADSATRSRARVTSSGRGARVAHHHRRTRPRRRTIHSEAARQGAAAPVTSSTSSGSSGTAESAASASSSSGSSPGTTGTYSTDSSQPARSTTSTGGGDAAAAPPGPAGPGYVVGTACNPKCR